MARDRREYHRKWRQDHPDYHRQYYAENPEKFFAMLTPGSKQHAQMQRDK